MGFRRENVKHVTRHLLFAASALHLGAKFVCVVHCPYVSVCLSVYVQQESQRIDMWLTVGWMTEAAQWKMLHNFHGRKRSGSVSWTISRPL